MKIAISSDNHLDVNRVDVEETLAYQAHWIISHHVRYYFFGGDLFNDFNQTCDYFRRLQQLLDQRANVFFVAGNHDLLNNATFSLAENCPDSAYLHRRFVDLPGTPWRVIGNNGWYDYSFSAYASQPVKVRQWKNVYWLDSVIDQLISDRQRTDMVLKQLRSQLAAASKAEKKVIFITHFAPLEQALTPRPSFVVSKRQQYFYQMFRAMTGSARLGQLLEQSGAVKMVFYGHLHGNHPPFTHHGVTYYNQAVGVRNKRINEWQADNFFDQWKTKLKVLELTKQ